MLEFIKSQKGNNLLVFEGYSFSVSIKIFRCKYKDLDERLVIVVKGYSGTNKNK